MSYKYRTVTPGEWREGARNAVLHALDLYVSQSVEHENATGWIDADLPALFRALDAHMDRVAYRINTGSEPGSQFFVIEQGPE